MARKVPALVILLALPQMGTSAAGGGPPSYQKYLEKSAHGGEAGNNFQQQYTQRYADDYQKYMSTGDQGKGGNLPPFAKHIVEQHAPGFQKYMDEPAAQNHSAENATAPAAPAAGQSQPGGYQQYMPQGGQQSQGGGYQKYMDQYAGGWAGGWSSLAATGDGPGAAMLAERPLPSQAKEAMHIAVVPAATSIGAATPAGRAPAMQAARSAPAAPVLLAAGAAASEREAAPDRADRVDRAVAAVALLAALGALWAALAEVGRRRQSPPAPEGYVTIAEP